MFIMSNDMAQVTNLKPTLSLLWETAKRRTHTIVALFAIALFALPEQFPRSYRVVAAATENWGLLRERSNCIAEVNERYSALQDLRALQCFARSTSSTVLCKIYERYSACREQRDLQCLRSSVLGQGI